MDYFLIVDVLERGDETGNEEACGLFSELVILAQMESQVPARLVVHHQVEVLVVLKGVVHVHNVNVLQLSNDLTFVDHRLHGALRNNASLRHFLHCVDAIVEMHLPHFAEAPLPNADLVLEI